MPTPKMPTTKPQTSAVEPANIPEPIAPYRPRGMLATIREDLLVSLCTQRDRIAALQAEIRSLTASTEAHEKALLTAYEAGSVPPRGWLLGVEVKRSGGQIRPSWKDEAIALATAQGQTASDYEAGVRARTPPAPVTETKHLVVTRG